MPGMMSDPLLEGLGVEPDADDTAEGGELGDTEDAAAEMLADDMMQAIESRDRRALKNVIKAIRDVG